MKPYKIFQALSLDIVAGAIIFSLFISQILGIVVSTVVYVELGLAVWCIYTWDHLKDAKSVAQPSTFRHQFHKRNSETLYLLLIVCLLIGAFLVFWLPVRTLYMGVAISIFVLIYFFTIHFYPKFYHKETFIAILYGMGVVLGPFSNLDDYAMGSLYFYPFFAVTIAFTNLILFAEFDRESDLKDGYPSLALKLGKHSTTVIKSLLISQPVLLIMLYMVQFIPANVFYCFMSMIVVLAVIYFFRTRMVANNFYRMLGDGIFLIPLLFLI
ncbi:MAG: UbiA family prenyltransferase [Cyclobacteriaceae bacterium]